MAIDKIILFPVDMSFIPESLAMEIVMDYTAEVLPNSEDIKTIIYKNIAFIEPGCALSKVTCMNCGADLLENGYWRNWMDALCDKGIVNPTMILPCCGLETYIDALNYEPPVGFSRYVLEITKPGKDLPEHHQISLEMFLKCRLRKILVRQPESPVKQPECRN
ncbi:MAG: hypothetical protein E3J72_05320 [Planctomycetota bacterium]|nr:MAG: hypothetical protein E3J72_05320 [Planctomycetota bacterium]